MAALAEAAFVVDAAAAAELPCREWGQVRGARVRVRLDQGGQHTGCARFAGGARALLDAVAPDGREAATSAVLARVRQRWWDVWGCAGGRVWREEVGRGGVGEEGRCVGVCGGRAWREEEGRGGVGEEWRVEGGGHGSGVELEVVRA